MTVPTAARIAAVVRAGGSPLEAVRCALDVIERLVAALVEERRPWPRAAKISI